ncbi:MAG: hypothetical protein RL154_453 [Pseudomonadota bacterium]
MSAFDIVVIFLVLALGIKGLMRGFIKETCGLLALIGGVYLASSFASDAAFIFKDFGMSPTTTSVIGFLVIFLAVWLGVTYGAALLAKGANISGLGSIDNLLGFAAGSLKVYVILSVISFALFNIAFLKPKFLEYTKDSMLISSMNATGSVVMNLKPSDLTTDKIVSAIQNEGNLSK